MPTVSFPDYTVGRYPFGWLAGDEVSRMDTAPSRFVVNPIGYLTGPQAGDRNSLAVQNLREYAGMLNIPAADAQSKLVAVTDSYADQDVQGMQHVFLQQTVNGLPVLNSSVGVHYAADGRLSAINGGFFRGLAVLTTPGGAPAPAVSATAAVVEAAYQQGVDLNDMPVVVQTAGGADRYTLLASPLASTRPIDARLAYVYTNASQEARLAWHFNLRMPERADGTGLKDWRDIAVDAQTGEVVLSVSWVEHFGSVQAYPFPAESPLDSPRQVEVNPFDPTYSPLGWHTTSAGTSYTDTRGNNVNARYNPNDDPNLYTATGGRPDGGPTRLLTTPLDPTKDPTAYSDALTANLFYANNMLHDIHAAYGFTEAAGNYQQVNYSGAGLGNDGVLASALSGDSLGDRNNAFFTIVPDGIPGEMHMFRFDGAITGSKLNPNIDSDFDNGIMIHEYGHGVSTRLTGGPANANSLDALQSAGMGEGWSDFWALMLTQQPTDKPGDRYPLGPYILGQDPATSPGIRGLTFLDPAGAPYSFDLTINPMSFADYGAASGTEIHNTGAKWASALWDINWLLIAKYGFDPDLSTGYAPGGGAASAGNKLALRLIMDALKLQPANPTFTDARDAILQADQNLTGGQNKREIWTAFARRKLGFSANAGANNSKTITTATDLPAAAKNPAVTAVTPPGRSGVAPGSIALTFSEPMNPASFTVATDLSTFTGPGGVNLLPAVTGFAWSAGNTVLTLTFAPPAGDAAQGAYALTLGPDIQAADDGSQLDQNFNGTAGEAADKFTAYFQYDKTPLTVTGFSPASGALVAPDLPYIDVQFSEPVNPATVSKTDLQISQGGTVVTGASVIGDGSVVRFTLGGLTTGPAYLQIKQGTVADRFGFTTATAHSDVQVPVALTTTPFPTPLAALAPLGSQAYQTPAALNGILGSTQDLAQFTINLEAGQSLGVTVAPAAGLTPRIVVIAPGGSPLATATAAAAGQPARVSNVPTATAGTYTVQVSAALGFGTFSVRATLNAAPEAESVGGATNNTRLTAQPITGFRQAGTGTMATVVGATDSAVTPDYFSLTLASGDVLSAGLRQTTGGQTAIVDLLDPTGAVVANSVAGGGAGYTAVVNGFVATTAGTYFVRVQDSAANPYTLTAAVNGVLEVEPNDTPATATPVGTAKVALGGLGAAGDVDVYTFVATAGNLLRLSTATPGDAGGEPSNGLDPSLTLTTPGGTVLTDDNSGADGRNALLALAAPETGVYTLRVASAAAGAAATGAYTLTVFNRVNQVPVNVSAGGPYRIREGDGLTLTGSAVDPDGDPLTFSWDVNGDGVYGDATGASPSLTWAQLDTLGLDGRTAPFSVKVRATDGTTPQASGPAVLTVDNVGPTAALADTTTFEGQAAPLTVTGASDPSSVDTKAGFKYAFDVNDDGTLDLGDGTYAGGVDANATLPASLFPDGGPGKQVKVRMYVIDKDGGSSSSTAVVQVVNVAPTATPVAAAVAEGRQGKVTLDSVFDPSPADTAAGFTYDFDFNDDGTYEVVGAKTASVDVPSKYTDDGPGVRVVRARVTDKDGGSNVYRVRVPLTNVAPTATFFSPGPATEGATGTVSFAGVFDPSAADTAAGFTYSFDFDNDGTFDLTGSAASVTVPARYIPDGPGVLTVRGRIADKDGGSSDYTTTLTVANVAPTATLAVTPNAPDGKSVLEGRSADVQFLNPFDPSAADTAAEFRYAFDYNNDGMWDSGDGTYAGGVGPTGTVPAALLDNGPGTRTVRGRVLDRDGGFTDLVTTVTITNVAPSATAVIGPTVTIGTSSILGLTGAFDPSAGDTAAGLTYSFDFDGDGTFEISGSSPTASFTYPRPNPNGYAVSLRVSDRDGGSQTYTGTLAVNNAPPTATFAAGGPVPEGSLATVRFTDPRHPSAATTAAGFRYAFDLNNDGTFEVGDGSYAGSVTTPSATLPLALTAESGTRTVKARILEVNGLFTDYTATVTVTNVAPTATPVQPVPPAGGFLVGQPLTFGLGQVTDPSAADQANLTYGFDFDGDGTFDVTGSKSPTATYAYPTAGRYTAVVRVSDPQGAFTDYPVPVTVGTPPPPPPSSKPKYYAVGSDAGGGTARLFDDSGTEVYNGRPFGAAFAGGVRVATADVTGDGVPDLVAGTGSGDVTRVVVIDGRTKATVFDVQPFEAGFTGGVYVAAGDTDGDGKAEVVVTPDLGGGPVVAVYTQAGGEKVRFFGIEDPAFRGGARAALGDVDGDGKADLLVAAGFGGGPRVAGFSGPSLTSGRPVKLFADFFVFESSLRNGVYIAAGDLNGDGRAEVVVGGGPGGGPRVLALDGKSLIAGTQTPVANFFAGDPNGRDGVRVTVKDLDLDGDADVLAATATPGADGFRVRGYKASDLLAGAVRERYLLDPFPGELGGVFVG